MKRLLLITYLIFLTSCTSYIASSITKPIQFAENNSATVGDIKMNYYSVGEKDKPTLLFLHGGLSFSLLYKNFIEELSKNYFVVAVDSRGQGGTTIGDKKISYYQMAEDIDNFTRIIGIDKYYAIGHSDGGIIILYLSKYFPEKLIKGIPIAANYHFNGIKIADNIPNIALKILNKSYQKLGANVNKVDKIKPFILEMWKTQPTFTNSDLSMIKTPLLVMVGKKDEMIHQEHTVEMAESLGNAELEILPKANHMNILSSKNNIQLVLKRIQRFFES